jgi:hypothetical protein
MIGIHRFNNLTHSQNQLETEKTCKSALESIKTLIRRVHKLSIIEEGINHG